MKCRDIRYEYEVQVETKLIAHKSMGCTCPLSGEKLQGVFPTGITGSKQYGAGVFALVNTLLTVGYVSVDRTKQLLSCLRIPISTGAIQNMLDRAAEAARMPADRIKETVTGKDVVHFDEIGIRAAGSLHWLHCACSGPWRFYTVQKKRGEEGMEAMGVLPEFTGVAVHDFWSSYKKFKNMLHAMCCQHLERELVFAEETGNQKWAGKLRKLLEDGVDCFKTDFGERVPTDVIWHDGSDPMKMHNYYTHLYNKCVFDLLVRERGEGEACLFARSATAGGQQFPVHWGGDSTSQYISMAETLRGGLSLMDSGFGF